MNKKISVIVPVYNGQTYLKECLESIINQTYENLEIIIVNDGSTDDSIKIIQKYKKKDSRIVLINNKDNIGLFKTRLVGYDNSKGDYIAFVDCDDIIDVDYYRLLINSIENKNADIACAETVLLFDNNIKKINKTNQPNFPNNELKNKDIFETFMAQEGMFYYMQTIWNKIYTKDLWEKARSHYNKISKHLVMCEDIAFSIVLLYYSKKFVCTSNAYYYYRQSYSNSTSPTNFSHKTISDLQESFKFCQDFINEIPNNNIYLNNLIEWEKHYTSIYLYHNKALGKKLVKGWNLNIKEIRDEYKESILDITNPFMQDFPDHLNSIKTNILNDEVEYVSFDVFDTLVVRPFYEPADLFIFMNSFYNKLTKTDETHLFNKMRVTAEIKARKIYYNKEDIDINNIYETFSEMFHIDSKICNTLKEKEIELELRFCSARESVKQIFDMVLAVNKKIIIVSDMYLLPEHISKILTNAGFENYSKLYVSSDTNLLKGTGSMYKHVLKDLKIKANKILHIGDNWHSDIEQAQANGLKARFIPKTIDAFKDISNTSLSNFTFPVNNIINWYEKGTFHNLFVRCMFATIANKFYDNPFKKFHSETDFGSDINYLGYYALGMHLLSATKWLLEDLQGSSKKTIHFAARDGYLYQKSYDILKNYYEEQPKSNYLYISRKSLLSSCTSNFSDLRIVSYRLRFVENRDIKEYITKRIGCKISSSQINQLKKMNITINGDFKDHRHYVDVINALEEVGLDLSSLKAQSKNMESFLIKTIDKNDAIFDTGYSGTSRILMEKMGFHPSHYYIYHTVNIQSYLLNSKYHKTYYKHEPIGYQGARELLVAKIDGSVMGYDENGQPILEKDFKTNYIHNFIINRIQSNALAFVRDFSNIFKSDIIDMFPLDLPINNSAVFENFLANPKEGDMAIFKKCVFDDVNTNTPHGTRLYDTWQDWNHQYIIYNNTRVFHPTHIHTKSLLKKALLYYMYDKSIFREKVKHKLSNKPYLYKIARYIGKFV